MKPMTLSKNYLYLLVVLALVGATILAMQGASATYSHCDKDYSGYGYGHHDECKPSPAPSPTPSPSPAPSPSPSPSPAPSPTPPPSSGGGGGSGPSGPTVRLTANPSTITRGETSVLSWTSGNATKCQATGSWTGNKATTGEETISPDVTTIYGLVCTNDVGSGAAQTMVTVVTPGTNAGGGGGGTPQVDGASTTAPFYIACVVSPANAPVGNYVTFVAGQSGGIAPFTYVWTGDVSGVSKAARPFFNTPGIKRTTLLARDAAGSVARAQCAVNIYQPATTTVIRPAAPKPQPAQAPCNCATTTPPAPTQAVAPVCRTYTSCTDGLTYVTNGQANGAFINGVPTQGETRLVYDATTNQWKLISDSPGGISDGGLTNTAQSGLASLFITASGNPSRFTFLLIWYFMLLFLIGFVALLVSTLRRR